MDKAAKLKLMKDAIESHPDFPKPGVLFRDIFGVFKNVAALKAMKELLVDHVALIDVDFVAGLDSRGFLLGPLLSLELAKPFIPIRKKGKLPGKVLSQDYQLEYGEDTLEVQIEAVKNRKRAIIVDDLLATGGTMAAAEKLLASAGVTVVQCLVIVELKSLHGSDNLKSELHSLVQYN